MANCKLGNAPVEGQSVASMPQGTVFINTTTGPNPSTYVRLDKGVASINGGFFWPDSELGKRFRLGDYRALEAGQSVTVTN